MGLLDFIDSIPAKTDPSALITVRTKRSNPTEHPMTAGGFADQLIARVAVDIGAVRIVDGALSIPSIEAVSPIIRQHIEDCMPDVLRVVGEMERAREYGRVYRGESDAA